MYRGQSVDVDREVGKYRYEYEYKYEYGGVEQYGY
jgi:hypothetical protein